MNLEARPETALQRESTIMMRENKGSFGGFWTRHIENSGFLARLLGAVRKGFMGTQKSTAALFMPSLV